MTTDTTPSSLEVMLDPERWPGMTLPLKNHRNKSQGEWPRLGVLVRMGLHASNKPDIRFWEGNMYHLRFDDIEKAPSLGPTEITQLVADGWIVD